MHASDSIRGHLDLSHNNQVSSDAWQDPNFLFDIPSYNVDAGIPQAFCLGNPGDLMGLLSAHCLIVRSAGMNHCVRIQQEY